MWWCARASGGAGGDVAVQEATWRCGRQRGGARGCIVV